jgi:magnesium-transporting ATPase (P-type)
MNQKGPSKSTKPWHAMEAEQALAHLTSSVEGLSEEQAARLLAEHGPNRIPPPKRRTPLMRLLSQFHNVLIYVLLGAGLVTALLQHFVDAGVIFGVVLINGLIGFIQEVKAERAIDAVRQMLFTYLPVMQQVFATKAIDADAWLRIFAAGGLLFLAVEAEKAWLRRPDPQHRHP